MSDLTQKHLHEHVLGSILGASLGDAMGAATEQWHIDEIIAEYGGLLREIIMPPADTFSWWGQKGFVTDDCSQMFALARAIITDNGSLTRDTWVQEFLKWSRESRNKLQMGPSTRPIMEAIARGESIDNLRIVGNPEKSTRHHTDFGASNGAAMRVGPAGMIHPGDIEGAVRVAWTNCYPTHTTQIAGAGAGAIAAGTAMALLPDAEVWSVVKASLEGAKLGEALGVKEGRKVAGASVYVRIEIAVEQALRARDFEDAIRRIQDAIGNGLPMSEAPPAAVGIFVAANGDPLEAAVGCTNLGNDSDTVGAMAGAMAGALRGAQAIPQHMRDLLIEANKDEGDIPALADGLTRIAWKHWQARASVL